MKITIEPEMVPKLDQDGRPVLGPDGEPEQVLETFERVEHERVFQFVFVGEATVMGAIPANVRRTHVTSPNDLLGLLHSARLWIEDSKR